MTPQIVSALPADNHRLNVFFSNGEQKVFDVTPYLDKGIFVELKDPTYFFRVRAAAGFVCWPNEQDFSADTLYLRGIPCAQGRVAA